MNEPSLKLPKPPVLPFTMQANLKEYRRRLGVVRIVIALALIAFIYIRFGYLAGIISTVLIVATLAIFLFTLSKRSLTLNADLIEYKSLFGRTKQLAYKDISTTKLFMAYIEAAFGYSPRVIIGKKAGGFFVSLSALYWKAEDIDLLLATLEKQKVTLETYLEPTTSAAIAKQFPNYVGFYEKHPYWMAIGIVFALLIAITIFVLLTI